MKISRSTRSSTIISRIGTRQVQNRGSDEDKEDNSRLHKQLTRFPIIKYPHGDLYMQQ